MATGLSRFDAAADRSDGGLVGGLVGKQDDAAEIADSYWDFNVHCTGSHNSQPNCPYEPDAAEPTIVIGDAARLRVGLQMPTMPNVSGESCVKIGTETTPTVTVSECTTYKDWSRNNWDFGSAVDYPILRHGVGLDAANPACGVGALSPCNLLLPDQDRDDELLLSRLALSGSSLAMPFDFDARTFAYDVPIVSKDLPATIDIVAEVANTPSVVVAVDGAANMLADTDNAAAKLRTRLVTRTKTNLLTIGVYPPGSSE